MDITAENPTAQIWKSLRLFLDVPWVCDEIRRAQSIPQGKCDSDVEKQAREIGYCIRQAQEYFRASSEVGLPTRPNLLYYGAVSLSRALILLRQDATHCLDVLRKSNKHIHHGLKLARAAAAKANPDDGPEAFFSSLQCTCHLKGNIPWGHFALFYQSLVPCAFGVPTEIRDHGKSTFLTRTTPQDCADLLPLDSVTSQCLNALDMMKTLPDMYFALQDSGIRPDLCRGNVKLRVVQYYKEDESGGKQPEKTRETRDFFLDGVSSEEKAHLVEFYKSHIPLIKVEADLGANIHLRLTQEFAASEESESYYHPDIVDDINDKKFYILNPEAYLPEPAAHLVVLFCLGMLCRYYPDIWIKAIDENVRIRELTDSLLNVIYRKFPNLILDQLRLRKHYVHL